MLSRCLEVPEILLHIFELVFAGKNGYPDLAGLARTCKSFNEPALSVLWRTQSSLLPLVLCFPRDVLELSQVDDSAQQTVKFAHAPSAQDWERPLVYAMHIKMIKFELPSWFLENYGLHSSVFRTLFDSCPTLPVLPRLRELDHACIYRGDLENIDDATYMNALTKLSSPTLLQSLNFRFPTDVSVDVARGHLREVMEHCKGIEYFDARLRSDQCLPLSEYFAAFASLQKLHWLVVWNEIDHITQPSLRDISFPASFTILPNSFPSLVKLDLQQFSVSVTTDILKAVRSANLQEVHYCLAPRDNVDNLCSFLASQFPWQESMRSIDIQGALVYAKGLDRLFAFKNLRRLTIHSTAFDDRKMDAMSKAWPLLEDLCIINEAPSPQDVKVTLNSLVSLQTHCSQLQHLELRLDASEIPSLRAASKSNNARPDADHVRIAEAPHPTRSERLPFFLGIDTSSAIRNSAGVAEFLMTLFPRARIALRFLGWMGNPQGAALWGRVANLIDEKLGQAPQPVPRYTMFQAALPAALPAI